MAPPCARTTVVAVPSVGQPSRYVSFLEDAYLLFGVPKFTPSFRRRVVAPVKCGLSRANSPQSQPYLNDRPRGPLGGGRGLTDLD